jgi:hypothetical protein
MTIKSREKNMRLEDFYCALTKISIQTGETKHGDEIRTNDSWAIYRLWPNL